MSVFVYDYDFNAPTPEHLAATHEHMFRIIRNANPELPIICVSKPVIFYRYEQDADRRRSIIMATVDNARKIGDKNVYFVDGSKTATILGGGDSISVDGVHPNDLGFMSMEVLIGNKIKEVI